MGRILEALKQVEASRHRPADATSTPSASPRAASLKAVPNEEVPFIEVGGAGQVVEASATVLAHGAAVLAKAQERSRAEDRCPTPFQAAAHREQASEPGLASFTFRPLAARPPSASPRERFASELVAFHHPEHSLAE